MTWPLGPLPITVVPPPIIMPLPAPAVPDRIDAS